MPPSRMLILVRHAKSSWKDESLRDIDRPLNKRGLANAPEMGQRLKARGIQPELIVTSPAVRAQSTARLVATEVNYDHEGIVVDEELYGASARDVIDIVRRVPDEIPTTMVVGHNPTMNDLAEHFSPEPIDNVPTCGMLFIKADRWTDVAESGELTLFDYPKRPYS